MGKGVSQGGGSSQDNGARVPSKETYMQGQFSFLVIEARLVHQPYHSTQAILSPCRRGLRLRPCPLLHEPFCHSKKQVKK